MRKEIAILGSGFSSLAAACYLAQQGHAVTIYEKNSTIGGRARQLKRDGFTFDIGPTWYWMPDVFERFFADFGKKPSDYYTLIKLNPAYQVYFGIRDFITISDNLEDIAATFEAEEKGSGEILKKFMKEAQSNYDIAIKDLVYRPGESPLELVTLETATRVGQFFSNIFRCKAFGVDGQHLHLGFIHGAGVNKCFQDGFVGILQFHVFTNQADGYFGLGVL